MHRSSNYMFSLWTLLISCLVACTISFSFNPIGTRPSFPNGIVLGRNTAYRNFNNIQSQPCLTRISVCSLVVSMAKRRRKNTDSKYDESDSDTSLPDFDLVEVEPSTTTSVPNADTKTTSSDMYANTKDLIRQRDRELERKMTLLKNTESVEKTTPLPSMKEYVDSKKPSTNTIPTTNKKKNKKRDNTAEPTSREEPNFIIKLLFGDSTEEEEEEEVNAGNLIGKIVEKGAWAGIFLLVAWELYLNSPLFTRQGPLAPFVFRSEPLIF